jgi:CHAD domain-containing protein
MHRSRLKVENGKEEDYKAMNADVVSLNGKSTIQPGLSGEFDRWRKLLARCGEKANRKRVHTLRVATLRLKAEIDFRLLGHDTAVSMSDSAKRWKKEARKLRRVLGPVRDTDVHLEVLETLRGPNVRAGEESQLTQACMQEIEELKERLHEERNSAEKELLAEIENRRGRLDRASTKLEDTFANHSEWTDGDRSRLIRGIVAGLAAEVAGLSGETLHAFRKQAKTARYLADVSAKRDTRITRQAALLKSMQNAVGKWHDLQTLAERAEEILGKGEKSELLDVLKTLAEQSFEGAIEVCRSTMRELLAHGASMGAGGFILPPKKPIKSVGAEDVLARRRRSAMA